MDSADVAIILALLTSVLVAGSCPSNSQMSILVRDPTDASCECNLDPFSGGFEITCMTRSSSHNHNHNGSHGGDFSTAHFTIKSMDNRAIEVNCDDFVPDFKPAMFQAFGVDDVDTFRFVNCPLPSLPLSVILHRTSIKVHPLSSDSDEEDKKKSDSSSSSSQKEVVSEVKSLRIEFSQTQRHPLNHLKSMLNGMENLDKLTLINVAIQLPSSSSSPMNGNLPSLTGPSRVFFSRNRRFVSQSTSSFTIFPPSSSSSASLPTSSSEAIIRSRLRLRPVDRASSSNASSSTRHPFLPSSSSASSSFSSSASLNTNIDEVETTTIPVTTSSFIPHPANKRGSGFPTLPVSVVPVVVGNSRESPSSSSSSSSSSIRPVDTPTTDSSSSITKTEVADPPSMTSSAFSLSPSPPTIQSSPSSSPSTEFASPSTILSPEESRNIQSVMTSLDLSVLVPKLRSLILDTFFTDDSSINGFLLKGMVQGLKELESLQLRNNRLTSLVDDTFRGSSSSLKRLYLIGNSIQSIHSKALTNLRQLQVLDLFNNNLTNLNENVFSDLTSLMILRIGKNLFSSIPPRLVQPSKHLKSLDLSQSRNLSSLPGSLLSESHEVLNFTINDTHLTDLSPELFWASTSLEKIEMKGGKLRNLTSPGLFSRNPSLRTINLMYNDIQAISGVIFSTNSSSLQELNLYGNELSTIEVGTFDSLKNLRVLRLGFNNLRTLTPDLFLNLRRLEELDLSKNQLTTVNPSKTRLPFGLGTAYLRRLNLEKNNISDFDEFSVIDWTLYLKISEVRLGQNRIAGSVRLPVFQSTSSTVTLDLTYNQIESVDMTDIIRHESFVLRASKDGAFDEADVGDKEVVKESRWKSQSTLPQVSQIVVRFDHNPLRCDCHLEPFIAYANRSSADLEASFRGILNRVSFDFYSKQLKCSSPTSMSGLPIHQVNVRNLTCPFSCPSECRSCLYRSVDRHSLVDCQDNGLDYIPESIVSPFNYRNMTLESIQVTSRPSPTVDAEVVILLLNNNLISDIDSLTPILFPSSSSLLAEPLSFHVYLDNNRIRDLPEKILSSPEDNQDDDETGIVDPSIQSGDSIHQLPSMVTVLSLRNNQLTRIPLPFVQVFNNRLDNASHEESRRLFLGHNPYNCSTMDSHVEETCNLVDVKSWLTKNFQVVPDVKEIACRPSPESEDEKSLLDMADTELCPLLLQSANGGIFFVSILCLTTSVILVLICVGYYRNKQTILAFVYIHVHPIFICLNYSEDDLDEDKSYDAFVSYSSSDRDVVMEMIEKLEAPSDQTKTSLSFLKGQSGMPSIHEGHSDQIVPEHSVHPSAPATKSSQTKVNIEATDADHYTLCIHERDWLPGNLISWNIVNSVQNSRRTILVLSKEFIRSIWFQVEFHTAYYQMLEDKMDRLIVVVKGDLPPKEELDKDLVFLLTTKTYLTWGEKWFWEKLRYALPHKKRAGVQMPLLKGKGLASPNKQSKADIMREYVDQTISDHFQLRGKSSGPDSSTRRKKNGAPPVPSEKGQVNESFVLETET